MDLIGRRVIAAKEGDGVTPEVLKEYANPEADRHKEMVEEIRKQLNFTTLGFNRLDDMLDAIGIEPDNVCTYCWDGRE